MKEYSYSFAAKLFYRYGNIPVTFLLLIYLTTSVIGSLSKWYFILAALINLLIIIWLNKYYIKTYRLFPFKIILEDDRLVCTDFFLSKRRIEILFGEIDSVSGGIFSGYPGRPTFIHEKKTDVTIGIYASSGKFNELILEILKRVNEDLYRDLLDRVKNLGLK